MKGVNSFDENGYWSRYSNDNWSVCKIYDDVLGYEYTLSGESFDALEVVDKLASLESQLSEARARLAGYEVGYDPAERMPDDDEQVITFVNSKNWCFSNKDILSYLLKRHYLTDSTRWFPLPGAAFSELAKGAE